MKDIKVRVNSLTLILRTKRLYAVRKTERRRVLQSFAVREIRSWTSRNEKLMGMTGHLKMITGKVNCRRGS